jgi:hypothetical protein
MDMIFGVLIGTVLLLSIAWDLAFVGIIAAFFLLAIAYIAGCESLRKGTKSK